MKRVKSIKPLWVAAFLLALCVAACSDSGKKSGEGGDRVPVEVAVARTQTVDRSLSYDGDVEGEFEIQVFSRVPDRIEKLFVEVGDRVNQGQVVALVRATTIEQAVRQAEAALVASVSQEANVRLEYERSQRLFSGQALSQQQLDAVKTQLDAASSQREQAEAMVKSARSQLHDARITAPITGVVATRNCEEGDMASPAQPLVSIVQMNRVKVVFEVAESEIGQLKVGQSAVVRVKSYPDRTFNGKLDEVSPVLDRMARMGKVKVILGNTGHLLKPGMFARVDVHTGFIANVVVVPSHATIESTTMEEHSGKDSVVKNYFVYVVQGDSAVQRKLGVAYVNHEFIAVSSGLSDGEQYVTVGQNALRDGARVEVSAGEGTGR